MEVTVHDMRREIADRLQIPTVGNISDVYADEVSMCTRGHVLVADLETTFGEAEKIFLAIKGRYNWEKRDLPPEQRSSSGWVPSKDGESPWAAKKDQKQKAPGYTGYFQDIDGSVKGTWNDTDKSGDKRGEWKNWGGDPGTGPVGQGG